jgi:hypothetical protein
LFPPPSRHLGWACRLAARGAGARALRARQAARGRFGWRRYNARPG